MITTKVNLPAILDFESEAEISTVAEITSEFIPKIKYDSLGQVGGIYKAIFYTRKDKAYRELVESFGVTESPTLTAEVVGESVSTGSA